MIFISNKNIIKFLNARLRNNEKDVKSAEFSYSNGYFTSYVLSHPVVRSKTMEESEI